MFGIKTKLLQFYFNFLDTHDWKCLTWEKSKLRYYRGTGKVLNYSNPQGLNEKLFWLTRYWRDPRKTICADKYLVRNYLRQQGLQDLLVPLLGVYDEAQQIDFSSLPIQFVLKCNHGCAYNIICADKSQLKIDSVIKQLNQWLQEDYSNKFQEIHYRDIKRRIVCEQLIGKEAPIEYQYWCVNGVPDSILVCQKSFDGNYYSWSYSLTGVQLFERFDEEKNERLELSNRMDEMVEYAKILAKPFPFVRVDFYAVEDKVYFAEMTFTPSANILGRYKPSFIERLGNHLVLPAKNY